tara:strand:- start:229 stop:528 length:300 start_codon:yes stop_codon:yes gene_type:complete
MSKRKQKKQKDVTINISVKVPSKTQSVTNTIRTNIDSDEDSKVEFDSSLKNVIKWDPETDILTLPKHKMCSNPACASALANILLSMAEKKISRKKKEDA